MILGLNMVVTEPKMIIRSILVLPAQIRSKTLGTPQNIVGCSAWTSSSKNLTSCMNQQESSVREIKTGHLKNEPKTNSMTWIKILFLVKILLMSHWRCNRSPLFDHIREQEEERRSTHSLLLPENITKFVLLVSVISNIVFNSTKIRHSTSSSHCINFEYD